MVAKVELKLLPRGILVASVLGCQSDFEDCNPKSWLLCAQEGSSGASESATSTGVTTGISDEACGNNVLDGEEICDHGAENTANDWTPLKTCKTTCGGYTDHCGDGAVHLGDEDCDEGKANSDAYSEEKRCKQDCSGYAPHCGDFVCQANEDEISCPGDCTPLCGDGEAQAGEQCDDMGNTADCDEDCTFPECGDGYVNPAFMNEQCDDKHMDNTDECVENCQLAVCGDGFLHAGVEECDDGNQVDTDACSNDCLLPCRIFVTASTFNPPAIQGVEGADDICQAAAMTVPGLGAPGNTWLAWLSDDKSSPSTRIPPANKTFKGYYLLPTGAPVAKGWTGLTSGTLMNAISVTEAGVAAGNPLFAWTNTLPDGTSGSADDCEDWSDALIDTNSGRGSLMATSEQWTVAASADCALSLRLYCIEVSP